MMKWALKFILVSGERSIFDAVLRALDLTITERDNALIAHGASLDSMDNAGEVHAHGSRIVGRLSELRTHESTLAFDVALDGVIHVGPDGEEVSNTISLNGVGAVSCVGSLVAAVSYESPEAQATREAEERRLEYQRRERLAVTYVVPAVQSPIAADVNKQLALEQTPTALYNVIEIMQRAGAPPLSDFAPEDELERFKYSMCHRAAVGDQARHVGTSHIRKPPKNPMLLQEAREFVARIARLWLERRAGLS